MEVMVMAIGTEQIRNHLVVYPNGGSLGKSNPCEKSSSSVSTPAKKPTSTEKKSPTKTTTTVVNKEASQNTAPVISTSVEKLEFSTSDINDNSFSEHELIKQFGVTANDKEDGKLLDVVDVQNELKEEPGSYVVKFLVSDKNGLSSQIERNVIVNKSQESILASVLALIKDKFKIFSYLFK